MFARCTFIFALRNIAVGGYLDTRRNISNIYGTAYGLKHIYIHVYIYRKSVPLNRPESSLRSQLVRPIFCNFGFGI